MKSITRLVAGALWLAMGWSLSASAQPVPDFYKNKQIRLIVGYPSGNDYDIGARVLAKYLPKYIPGQPAIIVQNMPQAASLGAANYIYAQAPRDGTVIGSFSRNLVTLALLGHANIEVDPRRLIWLGATSFPARVCVVSSTAPVKTPADLFTHELIVGSNASGSSNSIVPTVLNRVLGTKFHIIEGYRGAPDAVLAAERGEVQGVCASLGQFRSFANLFDQGKLRILLRAEEAAMPEAPNVPSIFEYAKTDDQRRIMRFVFSTTEFGRSYVFPPDVPSERTELMRKAIANAAQDPELVAEAKKINLDMAYRSPQDLEVLVGRLYQTPPEMLETVKKLVPNP
ncbi:MAG TPA: tripartite tricarboxylate transporter substrate-binding protein [Xanthobacteraceae bacterium]|jgi:tripartite-type tricarboxylate transporter receptor subunit TctC